MSFPKAEIKRFNDVTTCAPPPGKYNPKLPSVSNGSGCSFPKGDRFRQEAGSSGSGSNLFAIPITPSPLSCRRMIREITSTGRGRMMRPSFNRSNSTFSLPANPRGAYDSTDEDDILVLRRCNNEDQLIAKVQDQEEQLQNAHDSLIEVAAEKDQLAERVNQLTNDLRTAEARVSQLEENLRSVEAVLREKEGTLSEQSARFEVVRASLEATKHQFKNASEQNEQLQQANRRLATQAEEKEKTIQAVSSELQKQLKQKAQLQEQIQELRNSRSTEVEGELKEHQRRYENLVSELATTQEELAAVNETVETWKRQAEMKEQFNNELQITIQKNDEYIKQLEAKVEALQEEVQSSQASCENKMAQCREELHEALTRAAEAECELAKKMAEVQAIALTVDSLTYEQEVLGNELEQLRADVRQHEEAKQDADALISEKDSELEALRCEIEMERAQAAELRNKIKEVEAELDMSARSYHNSNELLKEEKLKRERLQNQLIELQQRIGAEAAEYEDKIKDLEAKIAEETTKLEETKYTLSMEQANCSQLNSQLLQKCQELDVCQQNLHSAAHRVGQLESSLQEAVKEKDRVGHERDELSEQFKEMALKKDQEISHLQDEMVAERSRVQELQESRSKLEQAIAKANQELESERNHRENIEKELSDVHQQVENLIAERTSDQETHAKNVRELEEKISDLELELEKRSSSLKDEEARSNALMEELTSAKAMLSENSCRLNEMNDQIIKLLSVVSEKDAELQQIKTNAAEIEETLTSERKKVDELRLTVADQGIKIVTLEESVTQKELELSSVLRSLDDEKAHVEILTAKVDVTEKELLSLQKALDTCSELLSEEQRTKANLQAKLQETEKAVKLLEQQRAHEKDEHQKRINELENQATDQAIQIAQLKDELDLLQCQANELTSRLYDKGLKLVESQKEREKALADFKRERNEFETIRQQLSDELAKSQTELTEAVKKVEELKARYDAVVEEREKHIQRLKQAELKLADYLDLQLRGCNQATEIKKSETEILVLKNSLAKLEHHALTSKQKLATIEAEIAKHAASSEHWKQLHESTSREAQALKAERAESQEKLAEQQSQIRSLEAQNANLQNLIGPFKEQLKEYKDHLDMEQDAAARQALFAKEIADKYASLVGHQNPKQRIHHMQKLKNDNLTLKDENTTLKKKLAQSLKKVEYLESQLGKMGRRFDPNLAFKHHDPEDTQNQQPL